MKKINLNNFNFQFFLADRIKVNSLLDGAKEFGGATKFYNGIFSNIENGDMVEVNDNNNKISIYIPSTININEEYDNIHQVIKVLGDIQNEYSENADLTLFDSEGSWYDENINQVVVENITIITLTLNDIAEKDIYFFKGIAENIKAEMNQSGVSIQINNSLAIV